MFGNLGRSLLALFLFPSLNLAPRAALGDTNASREISVFNFGQQYSAPNGTQAISREVSIFNFSQQSKAPNGIEAISREFSVFDSGPQYTTPKGIEAMSRELSIFNFPPQSAAPNGIEVGSREFSLFNFGRLSSAPNGTEADSRELSLYNFGSNVVSIAIGSTVVPVGDTGEVLVTFSTLIPLTNVLVAIGYPANSLTNWSVLPQPPLTGSALVSSNSELYASFSSPQGQPITTNLQQLGQLVFTPSSNQPSAFLPLLVEGVQSRILRGPVTTQTQSAMDGEVVVLNKNPLLRWTLDTDGLQFIKLYAYTGTNYDIEATTNLNPPISWTAIYSSLMPSNYVARTPDVIMTNQMMFFRATQ